MRPSISTYGFQGSDSHVASCHAACTHTHTHTQESQAGRIRHTQTAEALRAGQTPGAQPAELTDGGMQAAAGHKTPKSKLPRPTSTSGGLLARRISVECSVMRGCSRNGTSSCRLRFHKSTPATHATIDSRHTHPHRHRQLQSWLHKLFEGSTQWVRSIGPCWQHGALKAGARPAASRAPRPPENFTVGSTNVQLGS